MKKAICLVVSILSLNAHSQGIKDYVQNSVQEIKSIDPQKNDFSDLESLKVAIGNARIVMLGEQSHGDASAFEGKIRIIKMLHEEMGFDVLIWESDFYGLHKTWQKVNEIGLDSVRKNIFAIWNECQQAQPLFEYAKLELQGEQPLIFSGCDSRHHGNYTRKNYVRDFENLLISTKSRYYDSDFAKLKPILKEVIDKEYFSIASNENQIYFDQIIRKIKTELSNIEFRDKSFWLQELINLNTYALFAWKNNPKNVGLPSEERDIQMGKNLIWLVDQKYPNKKLIFWAHNAHILKNPHIIEGEINHYPRAGDFFVKNSDTKSYIVGFNSYTGESQWVKPSTIKENIKSKRNTVEHWFYKTGYKYSFLDFTNFTTEIENYKMSGVSHHYEKSNWHKNYDGIFFIGEMEGCKLDAVRD